ncbi:zinc-dependent alcohol dehydrogenase [Oceaniglobus ichthyenteri]|uniref:zinc-dependent alcohol dehydrogenase n=1 Tax=Oceaniglobus ichthyenteri TaxID=2136177 RepID=UPI000D34DBD0|nr:alcohol dehydrogenase catalytic domain-containing protein [Oceaniglobus ichthyenteri]
MKALIYTGPEAMDYTDAPMPTAGKGERLIRVDAVGICGSDMHAYLGHDERRPAPLILGHEAAGVVVGGVDDGRRVTVNPLVTCGECRDCRSGRTNLCAKRQIISMPPREGAFAEYIVMPEGNLVTVPDDIPLPKAALAEPLACAWHGVKMGARALHGPLSDQVCVVIGGGAIGVGAALSLIAQGATDVTVIEPNATRRATLQTIAGFTTVAPENAPDAADLVIDAVGYEATREQASTLARPGGVIAHIGLGSSAPGLNIRRMTLQEITFIGIYTYTAQDFRDTAQAIFDGRFGSLDWIETRPLSNGQKAFADIRAGLTAAPKTVLIPAHQE